MKTCGQLLKRARLEKGFSVKKVAEGTKIRPQYLRALEKDDYSALPSIISTKGFIKNYADFLGMESKDVLAVFRRDFDEKKAEKAGEKNEEIGQSLVFNWTPRWTAILIVGFLVLLFLAYLFWQYQSLVSAPYY